MNYTTAHQITYVTLAVLAVACFAYAVLVLGFQSYFKSKTAQTVNAAILVSVWAICPPVWFWAERAIWETMQNKKLLAAGQEHAKDFWIGLGAVVAFLAAKRFQEK